MEDCAAILESGEVDINWKNKDGETALIAATKRGHLEVMHVLLVHGANTNIVDNDYYSPLHICARRGDLNSLELLLEQSNSIDRSLKTKRGQTALDIAKEK